MSAAKTAFIFIIAVIFVQGCTVTKPVQPAPPSFFNGDALPDAPDLAARGEFHVGVRTIDLVHKHQLDILHSKNGIDTFYDRPLKIEVWYPAIVPAGLSELTMYSDVLGSTLDSTRPITPFTFNGRALRNAEPDKRITSYPLIIVSHGYPGSRVLLTYLTENLASKGYIVASIDHTESTHGDQAGFASTLLNRPLDILFVLNQMAEEGRPGSNSFLAGIVDTNSVAMIGYSMGGYGVMNVAGAGFSEKLSGLFKVMTSGSKAIESRTANHPGFTASVDPRIKAVVAFAPWGMQRGVWDADALKGVKIPVLFVAGSQDDVSGYEDGTKAMYTNAVNADRYLLTYVNARHNSAPNPPPAITMDGNKFSPDFYHYAEPAWDQRRINNINQHFVTAFLGIYLKQKDYSNYLNLTEKSNEKNWVGFKPRTSVGLEFLHSKPVQ